MKKFGVGILIVIVLAALFNWVIYPDSCYLKAIPVECHDDEGNTDTCSVYSMENVCERHRITEELLLKYQKDMQNPEIIDDCVTVDGEDKCAVDIEEPVVEEPIYYDPESNVLSVDEDKILSMDELKKLCEEQLKEIEPNNPRTTWTEEKLFINTYGFRGYTASDGMHNGSHTYCNITLDGLILTDGFTREATMDELHLSDFGNAGGLGNDYPNLKEYYGFVGTIVLGNRLQTTYITGKNILYFDNSRGIALKLGEEFDGGLIREIDIDEGGLPHSEIIFLVKGEENEGNRTGINGYREMFTIVAISKTNLENFGASLHDLPFKYVLIGENNQYYFVETNIEGTYSDLQIFDVEDKF